MFGLSQLPARFTAAVSALALSLVLISATVSTPSQAQTPNQVQTPSPVQTSSQGAYVGVIA